MKSLSIVAAVLAISAPASAQALNETFQTATTGVFPPASWAVSYLPAHAGPGLVDEWSEVLVVGMNSTAGASFPTADAAAHQFLNGAGVCDDRLETPDMDLSSYSAPELTYDGCLGWAAYMAHTGGAVVGASYIDVSTDGGITWSTIWTEAATSDYYTLAITEDLTASAANQSQVRLAFHYEGDYAHEWGVDNVIVDSAGPTGPGLSITGTCPGVVSANAAGMTAGGPVVFAYGLAGSFVNPGAICNGLNVPLAAPTILSTVVADASGNASVTGAAPANACGVIFVVAVDGASCVSTGAVAL